MVFTITSRDNLFVQEVIALLLSQETRIEQFNAANCIEVHQNNMNTNTRTRGNRGRGPFGGRGISVAPMEAVVIIPS